MKYLLAFLLTCLQCLLAVPLFEDDIWKTRIEEIQKAESGEYLGKLEINDHELFQFKRMVGREPYAIEYTYKGKQMISVKVIWLGSERDYSRRERPNKVADQVFRQWEQNLNERFQPVSKTGEADLQKKTWANESVIVNLEKLNIGQLPLLQLTYTETGR